MSKSRALASAAARQRNLNDLEDRATKAASDRDSAVFRAQQAGATYPEIQAATGLSPARVAQVLRRQRDAQALPTQG